MDINIEKIRANLIRKIENQRAILNVTQNQLTLYTNSGMAHNILYNTRLKRNRQTQALQVSIDELGALNKIAPQSDPHQTELSPGRSETAVKPRSR